MKNIILITLHYLLGAFGILGVMWVLTTEGDQLIQMAIFSSCLYIWLMWTSIKINK